MSFLRLTGATHGVQSSAFSDERSVDAGNRRVVVAWMFEVCAEMRMTTAASFRAVSMFDRYTSSAVYPTQTAQCVAVVACYLSAKLHSCEQRWTAAPFQSCRDLCCEQYTEHQCMHMERAIISALSCDLFAPTLWTYVEEWYDDILATVCSGQHVATCRSNLRHAAEEAVADVRMFDGSLRDVAAGVVFVAWSATWDAAESEESVSVSKRREAWGALEPTIGVPYDVALGRAKTVIACLRESVSR